MVFRPKFYPFNFLEIPALKDSAKKILGIKFPTEHPVTVDDVEFEQAVTSFYEALYRFALSLAQSEADACDLVQDTFYTFATKGTQLRDKSKIKTWLFTTLHRKFLMIRRHSTRFPHYETSSVDHELPVVTPSMVNEMDGAAILMALGEIEETYRAPLMLHYLDDYSYRDIAEILEIPLGTVMSRLSRGKDILRKRLADQKHVGLRKIVTLIPQRQISP